jgi:hypothetical protein
MRGRLWDIYSCWSSMSVAQPNASPVEHRHKGLTLNIAPDANVVSGVAGNAGVETMESYGHHYPGRELTR